MIEDLKAMEREALDLATECAAVAKHAETFAARLRQMAERAAIDPATVAGAIAKLTEDVADINARLPLQSRKE